MTNVVSAGPAKARRVATELLISLGLFVLALVPRMYDLDRFVTADEAKWVYRSAQFLVALLSGDWAATNVNLTPAVTTTWLGSLGLTLYYQFNQASIQLPFGDWLRSLPEFRTELPLLVAARWPMVIFTALGIVGTYWLLRHLCSQRVALLAAAFMALDPHLVALSRILGHDAPTAVLMPLSILFLWLAIARANDREPGGTSENSAVLSSRSAALLSCVLSGLMAGLAFLSKAPALFLIPFTGLVIAGQIWSQPAQARRWLGYGLVWAVIAYLTFVLVWPAAWLDPLGKPWAVAENAFLSATDQEEANDEGFWLVPDLGPFYYIVHTAFKLSPLVTVGLLSALYFLATDQLAINNDQLAINNDQLAINNEHPSNPPILQPSNLPTFQPSTLPPFPSFHPLLGLLAFALLFTLFMTLGDKRSPRYLLPVVPALATMAAAGWLRLTPLITPNLRTTIYNLRQLDVTENRKSGLVSSLLVFSAAVILMPYAPYYFSYYNPLVGGPFTAPSWVKIGWGEGLDQVGRFLQREVSGSRVGAPYASTIAPFFEGRLLPVTAERLDYVVLYTKQIQAGDPAPGIIDYYRQAGPIFRVALNGLHYAEVYPGPAVQLAPAPSEASSIPVSPLGFRPSTAYGQIGESLTVDVLWPTGFESAVVVALEPAAVEAGAAEQASLTRLDPANSSVSVQAVGWPAQVTANLIVSRHRLELPGDLARGAYVLRVEGQPLGQIELRRFSPPAQFAAAGEVVFGEQIALTGYRFNPGDDALQLDLAWQALAPPQQDYTVFAQILDAETNQRLAGVDLPPLNGQAPTSQWLPGEVIVDTYLIAIPFDFPPGSYKVIAGLYEPETGQRLTLSTGQDFWTVPWTFIRK
ncbi:MAG TPA: glycosyltransferase family 39 protein [Anaerolineae bacterium]|nr:glycosyltransferase family 39 protein [Anaerolineae bacterium]